MLEQLYKCCFFYFYFRVLFPQDAHIQNAASTGNRTRAARVAGEHSTTEPSMLDKHQKKVITRTECLLMRKRAISERAGPVAENSPVLVFEIKEKTSFFAS